MFYYLLLKALPEACLGAKGFHLILFKFFSFMDFTLVFRILRVFITVSVIVFITPQTSLTYYNYVLEEIHSTGIFLNYPDAKKFVFRFTWICIFLYIFLNIIMNLF